MEIKKNIRVERKAGNCTVVPVSQGMAFPRVGAPPEELP